MVWIYFEGIPCTRLGIKQHDFAVAQQIATIVPSGTLYKIDKGSMMLDRVSEMEKEETALELKDALVRNYPLLTRIKSYRLHYSIGSRTIMCLIKAEMDLEGLLTIVFKNDGTGLYKLDTFTVGFKEQKELQGKNLQEYYSIPKVINCHPAMLQLKGLELKE